MTIYRLEPGVQHYAWGDTHFIPELLGIDNVEGKPYAELWLGTHQDLPSHVEVEGERWLLSEVLDDELPYLFKILSAQKPLSIQAHPSEQQAREGFARENAEGCPSTHPIAATKTSVTSLSFCVRSPTSTRSGAFVPVRRHSREHR